MRLEDKAILLPTDIAMSPPEKAMNTYIIMSLMTVMQRVHISKSLFKTRIMFNCVHLRSTKESLTFEYFETVGTGWYSTTLLCLYILKKVEIWSDVTIAGRRTNEQGKIELLSH